METVITPLEPSLHQAYMDFFDHRAFSDGNPMGPCYCNAAVMDQEELDRMVGEFGDDCQGTLRRHAVRQLAEERIFGYLALRDGAAVGWCNAGDMRRYPATSHQAVPDFARKLAHGKTMSVICFAVAPECRGQGVASALLGHILAVAASQRYAAVEGYVNGSHAGHYWDFTGPARLWQKFGFVEAARQGERAVMRKMLKGKPGNSP